LYEDDGGAASVVARDYYYYYSLPTKDENPVSQQQRSLFLTYTTSTF